MDHYNIFVCKHSYLVKMISISQLITIFNLSLIRLPAILPSYPRISFITPKVETLTWSSPHCRYTVQALVACSTWCSALWSAQPRLWLRAWALMWAAPAYWCLKVVHAQSYWVVYAIVRTALPIWLLLYRSQSRNTLRTP